MTAPSPSLLHDGLEALASGQWEQARRAFEMVVTDAPAGSASLAAALDGQAEALWWLGRPDDAIDCRTRAYAIEVQTGTPAAAARIAVWLSTEYGRTLGNAPAAAGWLARAERLAADAATPAALGWVALARAERSPDPDEQVRHASEALSCARRGADPDLEILALTRLGLAEILDGRPDDGAARLDEAMAAATGGEAGQLSTVGLACCNLAAATELTGDRHQFGQWSAIVKKGATRRGLPVLTEFCECCRAEEAAGAGDFHGAELHLKQALAALDGAGVRARCFSPVVRLAELWIRQGRLEEAAALLGESIDDDSSVVRAELALASGEHAHCIALTERVLRGDDNAVTLSRALVLTARAALAAGATEGHRADDAHERLLALAEASGSALVRARAALVGGELAAAGGDLGAARASFESALRALADVPGAIEVPDAHLALARALASTDQRLAVAEAKAAAAGFDALGATGRADEAAALLRSLGDRSRVGPKNVGVLSKREEEVLRLVAQGLTNAEIAERLYISVKTAGNHVSSILGKLGMRGRAEAAAWAVTALGRPGGI